MLPLLEEKSRYHMVVKIQGKASDAVMAATDELQAQFGDQFGNVFQMITAAEILAMSDGMNALPRRKLGYRTPEERFDDFPDEIYAV